MLIPLAYLKILVIKLRLLCKRYYKI